MAASIEGAGSDQILFSDLVNTPCDEIIEGPDRIYQKLARGEYDFDTAAEQEQKYATAISTDRGSRDGHAPSSAPPVKQSH